MPRRRAVLAGLVLGWPGAGRAGPAFAGNFALVNGAGQIVTAGDFRGKYLLVMFGYTSCPDVCPATLDKIAQALGLLGHQADGLRVVFITVDPARDTPALTAHYAALFSPRIIGLSGTPAQLVQAERAFHVYVSAPDTRNGAIAHSALLYVLSPTGRLAAVLPDGLSAPQLTQQLAALLAGH